MAKTIWLVWATRGSYSDRTEYAVCWHDTKAQATAHAQKLTEASNEWRRRISYSDEPYGTMWDRAQADIGDEQWSPGDETDYQAFELKRGKPAPSRSSRRG